MRAHRLTPCVSVLSYCVALWLAACGSSDTPLPAADASAPHDADIMHDAEASAPAADGGGTDAPLSPGSPRWTILVYLAADNNLEGAAIDDVREMLAADVGPDVHVLLEVDRSPDWYQLGVGNLAAWESVKRLEVRDHNLIEVADLGELNTGDPASLSDFIRWGAAAYPSERKLLILWNHGNAWRGWGSDDTQAHDLLEDDEIARGIGDGLAGAGLEQFDMIGFDACLMSSLETAHMLAPFTRYLVASEELEPAHGWDYQALLDFLHEQPAASIPDFGATIVQSFARHARAHGKQRVVTLNTLDLEQLPAVDTRLMQLLSEIDVAAEKTELAYALEHAQAFGAHADPARSYHLVDLGDFAGELGNRAPTLAAPAGALRDALSSLTLSSYYGSERSGATGLSVYFPPRHSNYLQQFDAIESSASWRELLAQFHRMVAAPEGSAPRLDGHAEHHDNQSDAEIHELTTQDAFIQSHDFGLAAVSCNAGVGPELRAHTANASQVSDAWFIVGAELQHSAQVDVFLRKHTKLQDEGVLDETWDRHVLAAVQGQQQRLLFAEAKLASDDPRYVLAKVPLVYADAAPADLDHPDQRCPCAQLGDPGYSDLDHDAHPDCADTDVDGDGVPDKQLDEHLRCPRKEEEGCPEAPKLDNCPYTPNAGQEDSDANGVGDACDDDKPHAPRLLCRPAATGPAGDVSAAWWLVTIDRATGQDTDVTLFIAGPDGAAEAKPGPEAVLWSDIPHLGKGGELVWEDEVPLPFEFGLPIHFRFLELNEMVVLDGTGAPKLDAAGHAHSLFDQLGYSQLYLALEIEDFAGRADSAGVMIGLRDCAPCHDLSELEAELDEAAKPRCYSSMDEHVCGDGVCQRDAGEDCEHCSADCGSCRCGDGECSVDMGEDCHGCSEDCGSCPVCGDLICQVWRSHAAFSDDEAESCALCPGDCGSCAGDCCTSSTQAEAFEGGGCGLQPVAACVCTAHPECCRSGWAESCVSYARSACGLACDTSTP